jgi:hypothetical protein
MLFRGLLTAGGGRLKPRAFRALAKVLCGATVEPGRFEAIVTRGRPAITIKKRYGRSAILARWSLAR